MDIREAKRIREQAPTRISRVVAERLIGSILSQMEERGELISRGQRRNNGKLSLSDLGIKPTQAHRWKRLSELSNEAFQSLVSNSCARQRGPSCVGVLDLMHEIPAPRSFIDQYIMRRVLRSEHGSA